MLQHRHRLNLLRTTPHQPRHQRNRQAKNKRVNAGTETAPEGLPSRKVADMTDEPNSPNSAVSAVARLVAETGITEAQARELILFLGYNWSSLMREARLLKRE